MTPHLLMRPLSSTTILPDLWSSMYSNSLMYPGLRERGLGGSVEGVKRESRRGWIGRSG
jgi:hypothetical protein